MEGKVEEPKVYTLQASAFGVDVVTTLAVAASVATILQGIALAFEKIKKFAQLRDLAQELRVPREEIDKLSHRASVAMAEKLDELQVEITNASKLSDGARKNELVSGVRLRMNGLANRMDRNFYFEVRTAPPEDPEDTDEEQRSRISALTTIRFETFSGQRLLALPEDASEEAPDLSSASTISGRSAKRARTPRKKEPRKK